MSVNVDANIDPLTDLFGKTVDDLQEDVIVSADGVTGTLKYVADDSSAYGAGEDSGNYLVLHCSITDKSSQTIPGVASKEGYEDSSVTLDLSQLVLESQGI